MNYVVSRLPLFLFLVLPLAGCGPEAEVGVHFSRLSGQGQQETPSGLSADSIPPTDSALLRAVPDAGLNYLMGKFAPATHPDFLPVGSPYTRKTGMLLRRETLEAFKKMWAAAKKDGIDLFIISSTRTFAQQKGIWEGKWTRFAADYPQAEDRARKILEYSAMPGASRHHWGTDIDLNDLNNPSFEPGGRFENVYRWLKAHASEYGFCQPYSPKGKERPNGYNEEKWHWSYLPVATPLLQQYRRHIHDDMITGFSGAATAPALHIVDHYALGINPKCE